MNDYRCSQCEGYGVVDCYAGHPGCANGLGCTKTFDYPAGTKYDHLKVPHVHNSRCFARTEANRCGHSHVCDKCQGSGKQTRKRVYRPANVDQFRVTEISQEEQVA